MSSCYKSLFSFFFFFFSSRRRHTRCSRDWSSDVCSSDLAPSGPGAPLLHGDQIKLAERLLIKQRPFLTISAAPVFMTTRNSEEIARADAFGTGIIPVQVGAAQDDEQHVRRMRVHPRVESGTELRKHSEWSLGGIAPRDIARDPRNQRGVF